MRPTRPIGRFNIALRSHPPENEYETTAKCPCKRVANVTLKTYCSRRGPGCAGSRAAHRPWTQGLPGRGPWLTRMEGRYGARASHGPRGWLNNRHRNASGLSTNIHRVGQWHYAWPVHWGGPAKVCGHRTSGGLLTLE